MMRAFDPTAGKRVQEAWRSLEDHKPGNLRRIQTEPLWLLRVSETLPLRVSDVSHGKTVFTLIFLFRLDSYANCRA